MKYYGVRVGRVPGVYNDWQKAMIQTRNFSGSIVKSFPTENEALTFVNGCKHDRKYYVVRKGRVLGIFLSEEYQKKQTSCFKGAEFKAFTDGIQAIIYFSEAVKAKKYYAVQSGKEIGVFVDPNTYEQQLKNCKEAKGKAFNTLFEAVVFMGGELLSSDNVPDEPILPEPTDSHCVAYVDGSYCHKNNAYAMGVVLLTPDKRLEIQQAMNNPDEMKYGNVSGELHAAKTAVETAITMGFPEITLVYDFLGIEEYLLKQVATESMIAETYKKFMKKAQKKIKINFHKVKSHSGVKLNNQADKLAKTAIRNKQFHTQIVIVDC